MAIDTDPAECIGRCAILASECVQLDRQIVVSVYGHRRQCSFVSFRKVITTAICGMRKSPVLHASVSFLIAIYSDRDTFNDLDAGHNNCNNCRLCPRMPFWGCFLTFKHESCPLACFKYCAKMEVGNGQTVSRKWTTFTRIT